MFSEAFIKIKKILSREFVAIFLLLIIFILIRSLNFSYYLNFSHDQGLFGLKSLEIYQNKKITLIGPSMSLNINGREIFQGSFSYYFFLLFLVIGGLDPVKSSHAFMIFCAFMIIPLYFGIKFLINKQVAIFILIIYTLLPYYIDFTRFLWSPTFQFSLLPVLIYFMGLFKKNEKYYYFFIISALSGILVTIHYQFVLIIVGLVIYYFLILRNKIKYSTIFLIGFFIGMLPIIVFEIRNNFYNFRTLILFIKSLPEISRHNSVFISHYYLAVSLFVLIIISFFLKKLINYKTNAVLFVLLLFISLTLYFPKPQHAFGMSNNWNYPDEERVYKIINSNKLKNYNIANLVYDTLASVQKYLQEKDKNHIEYYNYSTTRYLYVISENFNFYKNGPYEVSTFQPSKVINVWIINNKYNLYLLERT